jgi:uncharacterized membrane protein YbjE (DUF340 family)
MVSFIVIGLFIVGIWIGTLFRKKKKFLNATEILVTLAIFALLFFLGISVGSDPRIVSNISTLGWQAVLLSTGAILGSLILAGLAASFFKEEKTDPAVPRRQAAPSTSQKIRQIIRNQSLWILIFFTAGILGALRGIVPPSWGNEVVSTNTLYTLMILVGAGLGADPRALEILKRTSIRILIVPIIVVVGSIGGSWLISFLISNVDAANAMAIGAGFGYYSLSAIFISNISGSEMGVIALLANIFREVITLIAAPLMVQWFGKLGAIASGGATAMDTTLPVIIKATGREYAVVSIFSGIVL